MVKRELCQEANGNKPQLQNVYLFLELSVAQLIVPRVISVHPRHRRAVEVLEKIETLRSGEDKKGGGGGKEKGQG